MDINYRFIFALGLSLLSSNLKASCSDLSKVGWILGDWQSKGEKRLQTEVWKKSDDNTYIGTGTTVSLNSKKPPFVESLRLLEMSDEVFYLAKTPQNKLPVAFKLTECSDGVAKFVNTEHDFPNSLHYKKNGSNQLLVEVRSNKGDGFDISFSAKQSNSDTYLNKVVQYVSAYNSAGIKTMQELMADNIQWMSIADSQITVETKNKKQLVKAMADYFKSGATQSEIVNSYANGRFVSVVEKASWESGGQIKSQCSPALYEFQAGLIKNVWYFSAGTCD